MTFLSNDIARCPGVGDDTEGWREGCDDRLRTLVSGKLRVVVVSQTDVTVAKMRSGSTFWVEAP